ncbi:LIV-II [Kingella potus]|uniref:Branched-chain amino acid transport system carrier protein n=1 Tax=Kingella potus TaxID=265175 RepID=A0A377R4G9_9NEIS|nr:branched-chain amino acid transport system II carrier protein [Kingella potus]UOP00728.1 branched-chain amino acid transport system II carrier protein [Kingella potus]STR02872.1 LIV-II [Kingella potus]
MSKNTKKSAFLATGLMLFALFFGSGNLIYPPTMGQNAGSAVLPATLGFLITGVGLPLMGVLAIAYSNSHDVQDLAGRVSKWYGIVFAVVLYLAIGPLFVSPRNATVAFDIAIQPFLGDDAQLKARADNIVFSVGTYAVSELKLWLAGFAAVFFAVSYWLSVSPGKLVDRVGKVLTPALLLSIAVLVVYAAVNPMAPLQAPSAAYAAAPVVKGLIEGYGTMDALASLVFAIIVIDAVRGMGYGKKEEVLYLTSRAGFVAIGFLALVYAFVAYMGASSVGRIGMQENGAVVLAKAAHFYFGAPGNVLLAVIVLLACLSTSVGLITSCGEYFARLLPKVSYRIWITVFTLVSLALANIGLTGIIKFSVPALMLLYPLTMVLIIMAFLDKFFGGRRIVYACAMLGTAPVAVIDGWRTLHGMLEMPKDDWIMHADSYLTGTLPLYPQGLGWLLPAAAGLAVGLVLAKIFVKGE